MPWTIYGKDNCKYCDLTKQLLTKEEMPYKYYDYLSLTEETRKTLRESTNQKTLPMVFYNSEFIGSYEDLLNLVTYVKQFY